MTKTITTTVPTFSRLPLPPLKIADTYEISSTNNNPFQTNTDLNATASQCQTLNQTHTAPDLGPSAFFPSSFSTVNPIISSSENTKNYTVPFVAMNKSVKTFDGLDHQSTPQEHLHQIDAHMILILGKQLLDTVPHIQ